MPGVPVEVLPDDEVVFHTGGTGGELAESALPFARALLSKAAPPCFISFLNLDRLFWNQIFTWNTMKPLLNGKKGRGRRDCSEGSV